MTRVAGYRLVVGAFTVSLLSTADTAHRVTLGSPEHDLGTPPGEDVARPPPHQTQQTVALLIADRPQLHRLAHDPPPAPVGVVRIALSARELVDLAGQRFGSGH
jgi:hypothetical protein